jgi:fatty acid desaturase
VHHTAPHIPFKPAETWNAAQAQLSGTVDCEYPRWAVRGVFWGPGRRRQRAVLSSQSQTAI